MQIVPLQAIKSQTLQITLGDQICQLNVYQKKFGLYMDVYVDDPSTSIPQLIIGGVVCENLNRIVRSSYLGFIGDFSFIDLTGSDDPYYTGLGSRFQLAYLDF